MDTLVQVAIVLWLPVLYIFIVLYCSYRLFYPTLRKVLCPPQLSEDFMGNPIDPETLDCRHARAIRSYRRLLRLREFRMRYTNELGDLTYSFPHSDPMSNVHLTCTQPHLHRLPSPHPLDTGQHDVQLSDLQPPPYEEFEPPSYEETIKKYEQPLDPSD